MCNTESLFPLLLCTLFSQIYCIDKRLFSGMELRSHIHKHLVKLIIEVEFDDAVFTANALCTGSIIKPYWIITAAHCVQDVIKTEVHHVRSGLLFTVKPDNVFLRDNNVVNIYEDDLALLKTPNKIKFGKYIQPIKLATTLVKVGSRGIVAGFGDSEDKHIGAREGVVVISSCPKRSNKLICSNDVIRAGSGDSGGPLIIKSRLVGLVSAGCRDVHKPKRCLTFYVNVVAHSDWIAHIMKMFTQP